MKYLALYKKLWLVYNKLHDIFLCLLLIWNKEINEGGIFVRKSLQKTLSGVIAIVMLLTTVFANTVFTFAAEDAEPTGTIWTIGDSTMCEYVPSNYWNEEYNWREGWGMEVAGYFNDKVTVKNIASSGRSARSYRNKDKDKYSNFVKDLKAGDYVVIQFGHNDQNEPFQKAADGAFELVSGKDYGKKDADNGTTSAVGLSNWKDGIGNNGYVTVEGLPVVAGSFTENNTIPSFEALLYEFYVKVALDKGAYPILATSIPRSNSAMTEVEKNSHGDITWKATSTAEGLKNGEFTHMNYRAAMDTVAEYAEQQTGKKVPVIDIFTPTRDYWDEYIKENGNSVALHAYTIKNGVTGNDRTHLSREGAKVVAGFFADGVKEQNLPLAKFLKDSGGEGDDTTEPPVGDDVEYGNVDGNAGITPNDASMVMQYVLNKASYTGDKAKFEKAANVDKDKIVTAKDAAEILKKAMNPTGFKFSGVETPDDPAVETTTAEKPAETTTEKPAETTTEEPVETTTEEEKEVDPAIQNAYYDGFDIVVDARVNSDPDRVVDGKEQPIFRSVNGALNAVPSGGGSEDDPVTIGIVPGTYREQIIVNKPWISMESTSETEKPTLTWYYVEGYTYDSVGSNGYYDASKPNKGKENYESGANKVQGWGKSVHITKDATGFKAKGIYFENSSNLYVTQEELDDNVRSYGTSGDNLKPDRRGLSVGEGTSADNDVRARQWIERGAALYTEADKATYINCDVIGTQDSLGAYNGRAYFKDCYLAGQVDFICGHAQTVFDGCTIHWQSSPYEDTGSALTASNNGAFPARGYLFWNCKIEGGDRTTHVQFARPWGALNTETAWINTTVDESSVNKGKPIVSEGGWGSMGNSEPQDVRSLVEYNTVCSNPAVKVDTSKRTGTTNGIITGGVLDNYTVVGYNPYVWTAYDQKGNFDGWDPTNSAAVYGRETGVEKDMTDANITVPAEITEDFTLPTVSGYESKWFVQAYTINENGQEVIVENTAAVIDDNGKVTVKRPNYGQKDVDIKFTAYFKKAGDSTVGAERVYKSKVMASTEKGDAFKLEGKVKLSKAASADVPVALNFFIEETGTAIGATEVTIPSGQTEAAYEAYLDKNLNIKATVEVTGDNTEKWAPKAGTIQKIAAVSADAYTYDIEMGQLETVSKTSSAVPTLVGTAPEGYTMESVSDAEKGTVYHYKNTNTDKTKSTHGYYWDLAALADNVEDLKAAESVTLEFSIKVPDGTDWGNPVNVIDILGNGDSSKFAFKAAPDDTRYVRFLLGRWNQLNAIDYSVKGTSGSKHEGPQQLDIVGNFAKEDQAKNKWKKVTVTINFVNESVIITGEGAAHEENGFAWLPKNIDRSKLFMVFYPAENKSATDEYYFTDVKVSYDKFK